METIETTTVVTTIYLIYLITNTITGEEYIGQTIETLVRRLQKHMAKSTAYLTKDSRVPGAHKNEQYTALNKAMAHHGFGNFKIELLEEAIGQTAADERERYYIRERNTLVPNGYNMNAGGRSFEHSEASIAKEKQTKLERLDDNRHECLRGMPPCVSYYKHKVRGELLIIQKHPLCDSKEFKISNYGGIEGAKETLKKFLADLEATGEKFTVTKLGGEDLAGLKGLKKSAKGYKFSKVHKGITYSRGFESKSKTDEEKRDAAILYLIEVYKMLGLELPNNRHVQRLNDSGFSEINQDLAGLKI